ncbi:MAG: NAD+ synthase, partial [Solirubrobacterales bacterium]|nr:NAD+ synthase [Solirubrobacterales bacterium]
MRLALHQLNATVGDIPGNEAKIRDGIRAAREAGAQLVAFPELALTGYPPEDLLLKEHFLRDARAAVDRLAEEVTGIVALVGFPERAEDVFNAMAVLADGELQGIYRKMRLPNYGVFDEVRYFQAGVRPAVIEVDGITVGLSICEDMWVPGPPLTDEALAGAEVVVNISASPYHAGKPAEREQMLAQRARDNLSAVAFCALVGGQDELVFDGTSSVLDHTGAPIARSPMFTEHLLVCDVDAHAARAARLRDTRPRLASREGRPAVECLGVFETGAARAATQRPEGEVVDLLDGDAEVYGAL